MVLPPVLEPSPPLFGFPVPSRPLLNSVVSAPLLGFAVPARLLLSSVATGGSSWLLFLPAVLGADSSPGGLPFLSAALPSRRLSEAGFAVFLCSALVGLYLHSLCLLGAGFSPCGLPSILAPLAGPPHSSDSFSLFSSAAGAPSSLVRWLLCVLRHPFR